MDVAFLLDRYFKGAKNVSIDVFDAQTEIIKNGLWQGTLIYMEIGTGEEIDPSQVVDHRADAASEYNETFVETEELESLW